jgi:hypothetical protein
MTEDRSGYPDGGLNKKGGAGGQTSTGVETLPTRPAIVNERETAQPDPPMLRRLPRLVSVLTVRFLDGLCELAASCLLFLDLRQRQSKYRACEPVFDGLIPSLFLGEDRAYLLVRAAGHHADRTEAAPLVIGLGDRAGEIALGSFEVAGRLLEVSKSTRLNLKPTRHYVKIIDGRGRQS